MIDTSDWKYFQMGKLFHIDKGKRLTRAQITPGDLNFIGAIQGNNGIRETINAEPLFDGNRITVNYNGCGVGEAFYQTDPFWASDDVNVLSLKGYELNPEIAMFLNTVIRFEKYRFCYGRKWNKEQMIHSIIKLPAKKNGKDFSIDPEFFYSDEGFIPDFEYMEKYIKSLNVDMSDIPDYFLEDGYDKACWYLDNVDQNVFEKKYSGKKIKNKISLSDRKWDYFPLDTEKEYFDVRRGDSIYIKDMVPGDIPYISTTSENNGITTYVSESNRHGNMITLAYDGSIGSCFYQEKDFFASEKIVTITTKQYPMNKYLAFFIIPILKHEATMYAYGGRKWTVKKQLKKTKLKLPIDETGKPDYEFMESYIKSLVFSSGI